MHRPDWTRRHFLRHAGLSAGSITALTLMKPAAEAASAAAANAPAQPAPVAAKLQLNARELGAAGDGTTKDTAALQQALDRLFVLGGGELLLPPGTYLTGALRLHSRSTLRLAAGAILLGSPDLADYPLTQVRWEGRWTKGYSALLSATEAEQVAIAGSGTIRATSQIKGRLERSTQMRLPALLEFTSCRGVRVEDCVTEGNDMWSTHPVFCEDVVFRNVTVNGGADGIDVDSSRHVVIENCTFSTGDDCISLKSGRGEEGLTIARPTENVRISHCTFADSHWACIGIGSETSAGIRNVLIEHCRCTAAHTFAIYIKSRPGRGAFLENITIDDLEVSGTGQGFLRINMLDSGKQDEFPVPGLEGIPHVSNFRFSNIRVHDVPVLVEATSLSPEKPLAGLVLSNISGTCAKGISLANITGAHLEKIQVSGFTGPLLSTYQVTGKGLEGATSLPQGKLSPAIAAPATPYLLH